MSQVGIPPPHNLEKLHALVVGTNNNNQQHIVSALFPGKIMKQRR